MAKQLTDQEQQQHDIKRKARRRLVGAVALMLIVIVVLPMVLDSEPKPAGQDIDLRIPSPDQAGAFTPAVVAKPSVPASSVLALPASAPVADVVKPDAKPEVKPATQPVAKPETAKTKPTAEKSAPVKAADSKAESYVAQVGAYTHEDSAKKVLADLKKWSFKAYSEKADNKVRVRVGPYAERDKAEKVLKLLEKHGLHPVIVTLP
jgi:DedD protein